MGSMQCHTKWLFLLLAFYVKYLKKHNFYCPEELEEEAFVYREPRDEHFMSLINEKRSFLSAGCWANFSF